ncbi:MAG: succinyl-diaminopimelate desuccinylase [Gammaproteobacteria bacterium]|nr:succinyl-diaminopimelate desuccinylase [Gammaproteobacteria bacterium]
MTCPVLELAEELIRRESVTPNDAGCLTVIGTRLERLGFQLERIDRQGVSNLWATFGQQGPMLCFAGHTDVVPTGDLKEWSSDPFIPTVTQDGYLRGRGAADMKSSLAAMVVACEEFLEQRPNPAGRISFLLTSDEEGPATDGTVAVVEELEKRQAAASEPAIDYCIVGEPSSKDTLGDVVRVGRRGSLNAFITVHGTQGHVAYPELVDNPIHGASRLIADLVGTDWDDEPNDYFPPTSFQVSDINAGTGATNVVPGTTAFRCNWRFSTSTTAERIEAMVEQLIDTLGMEASIEWNLSGEPFLTTHGTLTSATAKVIKAQTGIETDLSTGGGTSDGRFIAKLGCELIELGPINRSIHKIDEEVKIDDLPRLKDLYIGLMTELIG